MGSHYRKDCLSEVLVKRTSRQRDEERRARERCARAQWLRSAAAQEIQRKWRKHKQKAKLNSFTQEMNEDERVEDIPSQDSVEES